jgi:hypothetical protein
LKVFKLFVALLLCLSIGLPYAACAAAFGPPGNWIHAFVATNKDRAESIIQADDGGYVIVGESNGTNTGWLQAWLLKTDAQGNQQWNKTYGSSGAQGRCVIPTNDGGFAICGVAYSNAYLIKIDASGNMVWNRSYNQITTAYAIIKTTDGGYALAGSTGTGRPDDNPCGLLKVDSYGNVVWNKIYLQAGDCAASSLVQTRDGGYALVGTTQNIDFLLVKVDSKGTFEWSKTYGSQDEDAGYSILQDSDGSYIMAGLMWNRTTFGGIGLVKADSAGNLLWLRNYPSVGNPSTMVHASDGSYILCGGLLDKIGTDGTLIWSRNFTYDGVVGDHQYAVSTCLVTATSDGGYAVASTIELTPANPQDMTSYVWIGKLDAQGNKIMFVPEFPIIAIPTVAIAISLFAVVLRKCWKIQQSQSSSFQ